MQEEFKQVAGEKAGEYRKEGRPAFVEDEAGVQISQNPSYGWRPTNGRDTVPIGFSKKSVRLIGIMGEDVLYVRTVESTNSETFIDFLKDVRQKHPEFYMVLRLDPQLKIEPFRPTLTEMCLKISKFYVIMPKI